jgi:predicted HTH transcriptional regulator
MTSVLIFIIIFLGVAVGALAVYARKEAGEYKTNATEEFVGICRSAIETISQKETRKERVLALLREGGNLSNAEIRMTLGVSSRTAVRYLDELEAEGKVEQVGKAGHYVTYRLK